MRGRICAVRGGDLIQWTTHDADGRRRRRAGDGESVRSAGRERDEIGDMPQADVAALTARSADPTRGHRSRSAGAHARFVLRSRSGCSVRLARTPRSRARAGGTGGPQRRLRNRHDRLRARGL